MLQIQKQQINLLAQQLQQQNEEEMLSKEQAQMWRQKSEVQEKEIHKVRNECISLRQ